MMRIILTLFFLHLSACTFSEVSSKDTEIDKLFANLEMQRDFDSEVTQGIDLILKNNVSLVSYRSDLHEFALENMGWNVMGPKIREMYKEKFSLQELKDLNAFFKTASGKKFSKVNPQMTMDIVNLAQNTARKKIPEFFKHMNERLPANKPNDDRPILEKIDN